MKTRPESYKDTLAKTSWRLWPFPMLIVGTLTVASLLVSKVWGGAGYFCICTITAGVLSWKLLKQEETLTNLRRLWWPVGWIALLPTTVVASMLSLVISPLIPVVVWYLHVRHQRGERKEQVEKEKAEIIAMIEKATKESEADAAHGLSGYFHILARHSGKALDVKGYSKEDGAEVFQWRLHGGVNQQWKLVPAEGEYYHIIAGHSGKALDVKEYSKEDGAAVFQWRLHGGINQQWKLVPAGGEYYHIIARHSDKALDVKGYGLEDGTQVFQWHLHHGTNQQWKLVPVTEPNSDSQDEGKGNITKHSPI